MKSLIALANPSLDNLPPSIPEASVEKSGATEMMVLESAAGFYVGTLYNNRDESGKLLFQEPNSRDSGYFATHEEAARELVQFEHGDFTEGRFHP